MSAPIGITLLWALRSPCNLGCRYCYFGTPDIDRVRNRIPGPGDLTHSSLTDATRKQIIDFLETVPVGLIRRVFVAGGEPLLWPDVLPIVRQLKLLGSDVIICTNGLPLQQQQMCDALFDCDVDAVSISLDSVHAEYNDHWRTDKSGQGWDSVINGIKNILAIRRRRSHHAKVGIYSVVTRLNIGHIVDTATMCVDLGVDYFVIQPVSLEVDHPSRRIVAGPKGPQISL
jgi:MoaA/NifB/PqqE/SkfB family radical SAM enzyme